MSLGYKGVCLGLRFVDLRGVGSWGVTDLQGPLAVAALRCFGFVWGGRLVGIENSV